MKKRKPITIPLSFYDTFDLRATLLLMAIAILVFIGILNGKNMWAFIASYWFTLACKNIMLFIKRAKS